MVWQNGLVKSFIPSADGTNSQHNSVEMIPLNAANSNTVDESDTTVRLSRASVGP